MSFHKKMAASKRFMGQYVERLFERSLQRLVSDEIGFKAVGYSKLCEA